MTKLILVLVVALSLNACMTVQTITPQNKQAIRTVAIDANIGVSDHMYYVGPGFAYAGLLSRLPGLSSQDGLEQAIKSHDIQIAPIVKQHFVSELHHIDHIKLMTMHPAQADAILQLKVVGYGFTIPQGFSLALVPILNVEATLIRHHAVVWQNHYTTSPLFGNFTAYKPAELIAHPNLITASWHVAAADVAKNLLNDLKY